MSGHEKLGSIAFVVSICVIIGFAIVFSILFALYGYYKIKNIKNGHENVVIETSLKRRYRKILNNPKTEVIDDNLYYELQGQTKESKTYLRVDDTDNLEENVKESTINTIYDSIIDDKRRNKKFQIIYNIFFGILYAALIVIFGFALGFRLGGEQLFFGNTTLMTIQTGSMETINKENKYIFENNLTDQIEQFSLIGIDKVAQEDIELYDILAYQSESGDVIVHRVTRIYTSSDTNITYYTLKGDANTSSSAEELTLTYDKVIGRYNGFQNYGLGVTLTYLQSNIGLVAIAAAAIFLITYNVTESLIDKAYDNQTLIISKKIDIENGLVPVEKEEKEND